jgi:hypothetical protein
MKKTVIRNIRRSINGVYGEVRADVCFVDPRFQRLARRKVPGKFDLEKVGCLLACKMGKKFHLPDGGHRLKWLKETYPDLTINGEPIWLMVQIISRAKAVEMFLSTNKRLKVTPNTDMKCRKNDGEEPDLFVHNTLTKAGININYESYGDPPLNTTNNPAAFLDVLKAVNSKREFKTVIEWFVTFFARPNGIVEEAALQADFIRGMSWMLAHTEYDLPTIAKALAVNHLRASEIVQKGRKTAESGGARWKEIGKVLNYIVEVQQRRKAA